MLGIADISVNLAREALYNSESPLRVLEPVDARHGA